MHVPPPQPLWILDYVAKRLRSNPHANYDAVCLLDMVEALLAEVRDWECIKCNHVVTGGGAPNGGWTCACGGYMAPQQWSRNFKLASDNLALVQDLALHKEKIDSLQVELAKIKQEQPS